MACSGDNQKGTNGQLHSLPPVFLSLGLFASPSFNSLTLALVLPDLRAECASEMSPRCPQFNCPPLATRRAKWDQSKTRMRDVLKLSSSLAQRED